MGAKRPRGVFITAGVDERGPWSKLLDILPRLVTRVPSFGVVAICRRPIVVVGADAGTRSFGSKPAFSIFPVIDADRRTAWLISLKALSRPNPAGTVAPPPVLTLRTFLFD